jgi:hypothetical protein
MLTAWAIALAAAVLLAAPPAQLGFIAVSLAIQVLGFVLVARSHLAVRGKRVD